MTSNTDNLIKNLKWVDMCPSKLKPWNERTGTELIDYTIFENIDKSCINKFLNTELPENIKNKENRAVGALIGLAVADSLGAFFEFLPITEKNSEPNSELPYYDENLEIVNAEKYHINKFYVKPGQFTDDTSMSLCLADSLIKSKSDGVECYNGIDLRCRFFQWWNSGMNNAFRLEKSDDDSRQSIGLGGNIGKSLWALQFKKIQEISPVFNPGGNDAGNGSIMRLAPVPIAFSHDLTNCLDISVQQSFSTHPGNFAAACCEYLSFVIANAIENDYSEKMTLKEFLFEISDKFLEENGFKNYDENTKSDMIKLVKGTEFDEKSTKVNWNWRKEHCNLDKTMKNRGSRFNGYPNSAGYFGSFCCDGLALALFECCQSDNFQDAIIRTINHHGDADTTGAIAGQIAGAFYGFGNIPKKAVDDLRKWTDGEIELRARILFRMYKDL